jgi:hypothetical protein
MDQGLDGGSTLLLRDGDSVFRGSIFEGFEELNDGTGDYRCV